MPFLLLALACLLSPAVHAAPALLLRNGHVLTMDPALGDLPRADVLVRDGAIVAVGPDLDAGDAEVIDAGGKFVMPGFVDTHSHLFVTTMRGQFRNASGKFFPVSSRLAAAMDAGDTRIAMRTGALELLEGGTTTTADFFDNVLDRAHADAGIAALESTGIRAIAYYGGPDKTTTRPIDIAHLEALAQARGDDARVRLGLAWRLPRDLGDDANWDMRMRELEAARRLSLPVQVHVSGQPGPMFDALVARRLLFPGMTVVHATDATPAQLAALDATGASLSLTPPSEHRVGYGLTRLDRFAAVRRQGLGIDGNALAGRGDMFATLRIAALTWSGGARDEAAPDPRALLALATRRGAEALGLGEVTGRIAPGLRADLQVVDPGSLAMAGFGGGDPAALLVYSAGPADVETVVVDGIVRKRDHRLVDVDLPAELAAARRSAEALRTRAAE